MATVAPPPPPPFPPAPPSPPVPLSRRPRRLPSVAPMSLTPTSSASPSSPPSSSSSPPSSSSSSSPPSSTHSRSRSRPLSSNSHSHSRSPSPDSTNHRNNNARVPVPSWVDTLLSAVTTASQTQSHSNANPNTSRSSSSSSSSSSSAASHDSFRTSSSRTPSPPRHRSSAPSATFLAAQATATAGLPRTRLALAILRFPNPPPQALRAILARPAPVAASLVAMLHGSATAVHYAAPKDRAAVIAAAHTLCNDPAFLKAFLAAGGLPALHAVVRPALDEPASKSIDRIISGSGVFAAAERRTAVNPQQQQQQQQQPQQPQQPQRQRNSADTASSPSRGKPATNQANTILPGGVPRIVWNAAVRTIAKLMVCSGSACALAIDSGSLALLAKAAVPAEPMDIRLRAAAGLAAISAWSGPRRAVEIVQTEDVVSAMTSIITEDDERIPNDLRTATIDGLVVMSFRRHARRILEKYECEDKIKAAARRATMSGDYEAAARNTVAAGQYTGRSVDEYGFLVQDSNPTDEHSSTGRGNGESSAYHSTANDAPLAGDFMGAANSSDDDAMRKKPTGLRHIQQQLLDEPYTSMEDLNVLEEIVREDAGLLSSSPRERNYIRRAARTYGVSADEIEFISVLEEEASPQRRALPGPENAKLPMAIKEGDEILQSAYKIGSGHSCPPSVDRKPDTVANTSVALQTSGAPVAVTNTTTPTVTDNPISERVESLLNMPPSGGSTNAVDADMAGVSGRTSSSSPRASANLGVMPDPDFDGEPSGIKESPLITFSSATKRAAEKDSNKTRLQKSESQLSRETEHERVWRDVIDKKPEMLRRERGRTSRVAAYRQLATVPVPGPIRRELWPILLDTASLRSAQPNLYDEVNQEAELPDDIEHTIEADVTRTMPLHSLFWAGGAQVGVQSLRSILRAYARHVPEVGYCQGMSSIAAVLLMNSNDEEEAFLMFVQFMSRLQYKKVFAPGFPLMLQWIDELRPLVAHYMPQLSDHLEKENIPLELYADKWLITALAHNFPHRYLLRVWDLMFLGGSPKIILKACLAVLKRCEGRVLGMDFDRVMPFLQREFAEEGAGVLEAKDAESFIREMREMRFLPDLPKEAAEAAVAKVAAAAEKQRRGSAGPKATGAQELRQRNSRSNNYGASGGAQQEGGRRMNNNNNNNNNNNGPKRERRGGCLPCFRRSATLDD